MPTNKYNIEYLLDNGEQGFDEVLTFSINNDDGDKILCIEVEIGEANGIDGIAACKVSIPIEPDDVELATDPSQISDILSQLAAEGEVERGEIVFLNLPGEYHLQLEQPHRIVTAYYQDGFHEEITDWLEEFLADNETLDTIISMIPSADSE